MPRKKLFDKPMQGVIAFRLPVEKIREIRKIARQQKVSPGAIARDYMLKGMEGSNA